MCMLFIAPRQGDQRTHWSASLVQTTVDRVPPLVSKVSRQAMLLDERSVAIRSRTSLRWIEMCGGAETPMRILLP